MSAVLAAMWRLSSRNHVAAQRAHAAASKAALEGLSAIRTVASFNMQPAELDRYQSLLSAARRREDLSHVVQGVGWG